MRTLFVLIAGMCVSLAWAEEVRTKVSAGPVQLLRARAAKKESKGARFAYVAPDEQHVLPYVVDGENWYTSFYFINLETYPIGVSCEFVGQEGYAKSFKFDIGDGDVTTTDLPANAIDNFRTTGESSKQQIGWAYCSSNPRTDRFTVHAVIRMKAGDVTRDINIPLHPDWETTFSVPFLRAGDAKSNLILINTDIELSATFRISVFDRNGTKLMEGTQVLQPSEQRISLLDELFPDLQIDVGVVTVQKIDGTDWVTGSMLTIGAGGPVSFQGATAIN
ncbi:MAG: hypothetical protein IT168_27645 [Bryobacterales bacterium]|nr:hypothetical protein [Bryobacterales bacterium]